MRMCGGAAGEKGCRGWYEAEVGQEVEVVDGPGSELQQHDVRRGECHMCVRRVEDNTWKNMKGMSLPPPLNRCRQAPIMAGKHFMKESGLPALLSPWYLQTSVGLHGV
jgi:hypothetical protein